MFHTYGTLWNITGTLWNISDFTNKMLNATYGTGIKYVSEVH